MIAWQIKLKLTDENSHRRITLHVCVCLRFENKFQSSITKLRSGKKFKIQVSPLLSLFKEFWLRRHKFKLILQKAIKPMDWACSTEPARRLLAAERFNILGSFHHFYWLQASGPCIPADCTGSAAPLYTSITIRLVLITQHCSSQQPSHHQPRRNIKYTRREHNKFDLIMTFGKCLTFLV